MDRVLTERDVAACAAAIGRGEVVAFPTETYYGLGADPRRTDALARVLALKGREASDKPLLLLVASLDQIAPWVSSLPPGFDALVARYWPGPLTLVLPGTAELPGPLRGEGGGVAVRLTSHPLAQQLILACGTAITGTSANPSGSPPARTAADVRSAFGAAAPAVLDGGETPGGPPSTLLALHHDGARLLRAGAIDEHELRGVVPFA